MIALLRGLVVQCSEGAAVIDVGGVGYRVQVSARTEQRLTIGETVTLQTRMLVREDDVRLVGFLDDMEEAIFDAVLAVHGVGPKAVMSLLSLYSPDDLRRHIQDEDVRMIQRAPGIGAKVASRIILELKGKLPDAADSATAPVQNEAEEILRSLGIEGEEAKAALSDLEGDVTDIVREALRRLGSRGGTR